MNGFRDVCSSSGPVNVMIGVSSPAEEEEEGDDNAAAAAALSSEDSSCPDDETVTGTGTGTELDLALGLSIGLNSRRNHSKVRSFSSSSSSSLTRESGTKRSSADSSAAASKGHVAVGWPPLRTYRINSLVSQAKSLATEDGLSSNIVTKNTVKKDGASFIKSPMLVKVTMDGVIIGRKVDLNALDSSYESLAETLEQMFFHTQHSSSVTTKLLDGSSEYMITYQDKDGDWMLVGDVPWLMFLGCVKRLRIMRRSGETGGCK